MGSTGSSFREGDEVSLKRDKVEFNGKIISEKMPFWK